MTALVCLCCPETGSQSPGHRVTYLRCLPVPVARVSPMTSRDDVMTATTFPGPKITTTGAPRAGHPAYRAARRVSPRLSHHSRGRRTLCHRPRLVSVCTIRVISARNPHRRLGLRSERITAPEADASPVKRRRLRGRKAGYGYSSARWRQKPGSASRPGGH